jgi:hypothetical protein
VSSRIDEAELDALYRDAKPFRDRTQVTVGRAAELLKVTPRQVRKYIAAKVIAAEPIEGAEVRRGRRMCQWALRKGEVRWLRVRLEDWRRRHPTRWAKQLALPLVADATRLPPAWALEQLAHFRPAMLKVPDRELQERDDAKRSRRIA